MKNFLFLMIFGLMLSTTAIFAQEDVKPKPSPPPVKIARIDLNRDKQTETSPKEVAAPKNARRNNRTSSVKLNSDGQSVPVAKTVTMSTDELESEKERVRLEAEAKAKSESEQREANLQAQIEAANKQREEEKAAANEKLRLENEKAELEKTRLEAERIKQEKETAELRRQLAEREEQNRLAEEQRQKDQQAKIEADQRAERLRLDGEKRAEEQRLALENQKEESRLAAEKQAEQIRIETERRAEEKKKRLEAEKQAEQTRLESEQKIAQANLEAENRAKELSAQTEAENKAVRSALIAETARRIGFLKPSDAIALVPADLTDAAQIEAVLREKAKATKSLVRNINFCSPDFVGENYTFDVPSPISLSTLLNDLRVRFGVNFLPDSELSETEVQIAVNDEPWNVVLRQQLNLLDVDASCIGNNAIALVKRSKLLTLQDSQRKTAPLVTEYIKLRHLRPRTGVQSNLSGRPTGGSRVDTLEATIQKILTANGDGRAKIAQIPDRAEFFITATEEQIKQIKEVIAKVDRPTYRVEVYGTIYTVNETKLKDIGSQLSATLNAGTRIGGLSTLPTQQNQGGTGTGTGTGGSTTGSVISGLPNGFTQPSGSLAASNPSSILGARIEVGSAEFAYQLSLLEQLGVARRLESPFISADDGDTAVFENGDQIPVIIQSINNFGGGTGGQIEYIQAGTKLSVTPQVIEDENGNPTKVSLLMNLESNTPNLATQSGVLPSVNARRILNKATITQGQTFVFGGSNDRIETNNVSRTPGLGSLPVIGNLFKRTTKQVSDNKLYFAVRVVITPDDSDSPIDGSSLDREFPAPPSPDAPLTLPTKKKN
jgi:Flp pilus assembly secretin CpaC